MDENAIRYQYIEQYQSQGTILCIQLWNSSVFTLNKSFYVVCRATYKIMEASTYAWAVILTFFVLYATVNDIIIYDDKIIF